eukprot:2793353-Pleurochrysis_carterae.AAC.1
MTMIDKSPLLREKTFKFTLEYTFQVHFRMYEHEHPPDVKFWESRKRMLRTQIALANAAYPAVRVCSCGRALKGRQNLNPDLGSLHDRGHVVL